MTIDKAVAHNVLGPLEKYCILHVFRGSVAHGMYVPSDNPNSIDDIDTMAVVVPPEYYYFTRTMFCSDGTTELKEGPWDTVVYEARKFVHLLLVGNPNVLSALWAEEEDVIFESYAGKVLRQHRGIFTGKHVYPAFVGYAKSQLRRLQKGAFRGYMGEKRKRLVEKFGYDTKNAAHLIRLLKMGIEFLRTGQLKVKRTDDTGFLLDIKNGTYSLQEIQALSDLLFLEAETALKESTLPDVPDVAAAEQLLCNLITSRLFF